MKSVCRFLRILLRPRLPRFGPEDVAGTAEYYNRLARHHEASMNPSREWRGRISMHLALRVQRFKSAEKVRQQISCYPAEPLRTSNNTLSLSGQVALR
jgi:hypothetical protein